MKVSDYRAAILADRPVLYAPLWEPSGDIHDAARKTSDGSLTGAPTRAARGPLGDYGMDFPAATDARFADANHLDFGDLFSLECWFSLNNVVGQFRLVTKWFNAGSLDYWSGVTAVRLQRENVADLARSSAINTTGRWYHVVGTKNGTARKVYINGKDVTVLVGNDTCTNTADPLIIGSSVSGGQTAKVAHAAVYNYVLSPAQVQRHYLAGLGLRPGGRKLR